MLKSNINPGSLFIVATPIGNLQDISIRAIEILKSVDLILAEDTRHSSALLHSLGIKNKLESFHAYNENARTEKIIESLHNGTSIALISDAGTPLISDPGYTLVNSARQNNIKVTPIPGPCALVAALSAAGLPSSTFLFYGFLPAKQHARLKVLEELKTIQHTLIFYESTHRILDCLQDIKNTFDTHCAIVLAKELTKSYEHFIHDSAEKIIFWLQEDLSRIKGEFVLLIPPANSTLTENEDDHLLTVLLEELPLKQAVKIASRLSTSTKNALYEKALLLKK